MTKSCEKKPVEKCRAASETVYENVVKRQCHEVTEEKCEDVQERQCKTVQKPVKVQKIMHHKIFKTEFNILLEADLSLLQRKQIIRKSVKLNIHKAAELFMTPGRASHWIFRFFYHVQYIHWGW